MSENFNAQGEVSLEIKGVDDLNALIEALGRFNEETGGTNRATERLEKDAVRAASSLKETAGGADQLGKSAQSAAEMSLPRLRYALYDVASTAGVMNATIGASGVAVLAASASYERSFTNVERTTLASAEATTRLRGELMQLTREIPESWGFVTEVAAIGAQLDIAEENLASFTETTTKFSTVTGVSAEQSAMAFGSIGQLLKVNAGEYENLGSAIAYVGVNSVATDAEIIKMAQRLAASAENAGMTAQEVVALSGALASLRVAPERAQGVMEVYFKNLNTALAEGGERLEAFAAYSGMSAEAVREMVATDPAGFFRSLSQGLSTLDPVSTTRALSDLGLSGIRAGEVFTRVSGNLEVFDQALADSNKAWADGTHLADAYGLVVDDLASKWQIFLNGALEAASAVGDALAPAAKVALDIITPMVQQLAQMAQSPAGKWAIGLAAVLGSVAFALTGIIGTSALAMASVAAMGTATAELTAAGTGSIFTLRGMSAAFTQVATSAGLSTRAVNVFKTALASTGIGFVVVALGTLATAALSAGDAIDGTADKYLGSMSGISAALAADRAAYEEALAGGAEDLSDRFLELKGVTEGVTASSAENRQAMSDAAAMLGTTVSASDAATKAVSDQTVVLGENAYAWINNALTRSEEFQKIASNEEFAKAWGEAGLTMEQVIAAAAAKGEQGVYDLFARATEASGNGGAMLSNWWGTFWGRFGRMMTSIGDWLARSWDSLWSGDFTGGNRTLLSDLFDDIGRAWNSEVFNQPASDMARLATDAANQLRMMGGAGTQAGTDIAAGAEEGAGGLDNLGSAADKAAEKIYTLKDYASDLSSVWSRAFDLRFGEESSEDAITLAWQKMRAEADASRDAIEKQRQEIKKLRADMDETRASMASLNSKQQDLQYWLMVAENYGDTLRAAEIRAEMGENSAKLAAEEAKLAETGKKVKDSQREILEEQIKLTRTTEGNSEASINNRASLTDLIQKYQEHLRTLAENGASQEELREKSEELKKSFIDQALQAGYSRDEVMKYAKAFDDMSFAIGKIPRKITVKADTDPAIQALNEFKAEASSRMSAAGTAAKNAFNSAVKGIGNTIPKKLPGTIVDYSRSFPTPYKSWEAFMAAVRKAGWPMVRLPGDYNMLANLGSGMGYQDGGWTGPGGRSSVAGVVHGQEFVFSAPAVQNIGLRNLTALHEAGKGGRASSASATGPGNGPLEVELSPYDRSLLERAIGSSELSLSGDAMQRFVGAGAINSGRTGRG